MGTARIVDDARVRVEDHRGARDGVVLRFGRGGGIERMMGEVLAVQHRRETADHLGLRFEQLLPWHALDVGDAAARDPKLRQQLVGGFLRVGFVDEFQRRSALRSIDPLFCVMVMAFREDDAPPGLSPFRMPTPDNALDSLSITTSSRRRRHPASLVDTRDWLQSCPPSRRPSPCRP